MKNLLLDLIIPICGNISAIAISLSAVPEVRRAIKNNDIGDSNPIPYAFILANGLTWIIYGYSVRDWFVTIPNIIGFVLGLYFTHTTYALASTRQRFFMDLIIFPFVGIIFCGGAIAFVSLSKEAAKTFLGIQCIAILVLFYSSPLSTLYNVIKERNSIYFSLPLTLSAIVNTILWILYGFTLGDPFIYGPNLVGLVFSGIQLICRLVFPAIPLGPKLT